MQNNEANGGPNRFRRLLKEKGYYIVLSLCILAVGISGYVFVSTAIQQNRAAKEESLSVPVTVTDPAANGQKSGSTGQSTVKTDASDEEESTETSAPAEVAPVPETSVQETAAPMVVQPVSGAVLQDYAMDRLTYNATTQDWRVHNGVDLAAGVGQTVAAAMDGTVTAVYDDEYYGTTVVIQHDGGYTTHYCNLAAPASVSAGDAVTAGEIIGAVGGTALIEVADEPHLHFEVYRDGTPVDPADFLS